MNELKFLKGQYANYTGLTSKDANSFYVTTEVVNDKNVLALWLGADLIASGNTAAELQKEITRATNAEGQLQLAINNEASERAAQDENLQKAIEKAISDFEAAIAEMGDEWNEALSAETDARIADVNAEEERALAAEKVLDEAIKAEEARAKGVESALTDAIGALTIESISEGLEANVKEAFKLVDKDGTQRGATIKIYKDSALQDVELSGQSLVFTYILNDGSEEVVPVDVSKFLAETEFKDGLDVIDHQVFVNVADATAENADMLVATGKNFLEFESDGDGNKALAVRSIDTDSTVLQKDIRVAGLGSQFGAGNYTNDMVISAGTDIYTILQNILCKELYPSAVTKTVASASASMSNLTLTLDKSGEQEVGTKVTMTVGKTNGSSATSIKNSSVSGMEYGYSVADDDKQDSTAKTITKTCTTGVSDNNYTISATINSGFNADTTTNVKTTPTTATGVGSASLAETVLGCAVEGENKITINATGASFSYKADAIDKVYYCSNLGNTDAAKNHTGVSAVDTATSKPTKSATASTTGKYYYFLGYSTNTTYDQFDSASVRALTTKKGWITKDGTTTIVSDKPSVTSNGQSIVIACPKKYKLATINNGVGADILANFSSKGVVSVKCGEIDVEYMVYVYPITNGATVEFKNVTLTKA